MVQAEDTVSIMINKILKDIFQANVISGRHRKEAALPEAL